MAIEKSQKKKTNKSKSVKQSCKNLRNLIGGDGEIVKQPKTKSFFGKITQIWSKPKNKTLKHPAFSKISKTTIKKIKPEDRDTLIKNYNLQKKKYTLEEITKIIQAKQMASK